MLFSIWRVFLLVSVFAVVWPGSLRAQNDELYVEECINLYTKSNNKLRHRVAKSRLDDLGKKAADALAEKIRTAKDPDIQLDLIELLENTELANAKTVDVLLELLTEKCFRGHSKCDPSDKVNVKVISGLGQLGTLASPAQDALFLILKKHASSRIAVKAKDALVLMGLIDQSLVNKLTKLVEKGDEHQEKIALETLNDLVELGYHRRQYFKHPHLMVLIDNLEEKHDKATAWRQILTLSLLGKLGEAAKDSLPFIKKFIVYIKDKDLEQTAREAQTAIEESVK